jgi:hypothetical protein
MLIAPDRLCNGGGSRVGARNAGIAVDLRDLVRSVERMRTRCCADDLGVVAGVDLEELVTHCDLSVR